MRLLLRIAKDESGRQNEMLIVVTLLGIVVALFTPVFLSHFPVQERVGALPITLRVLTYGVGFAASLLMIFGVLYVIGSLFLLSESTLRKIKTRSDGKGSYAEYERRVQRKRLTDDKKE
jgi:hypothetical protein